MAKEWRRPEDAPERMTCADARVLAGIYRIDPVSRGVPRSSVSSSLGPWVELRYIDPRPDAPMTIRPQFQEEWKGEPLARPTEARR